MKTHSLLVAAFIVTCSMPAAAQGVSNYEVITETTLSNSDGLKDLLVDCPAGKQLLGGSARIFGSINGAALTTSGPEGPPEAPTGWYGVAHEVMATNDSWGLRVDAVCGNVAGYEVVTKSTVSNSDEHKSVFVDGPVGKQLIGGGTRIFGSIDGQALDVSGPDGDPDAPTQWFGGGQEIVASNNSWGVRVDGIYANIGSGYEVVTDSTTSNSDSPKSLTVAGAPGALLLGGGSRIFGSVNGTGLTASAHEGPPAAPTEWFGVAHELAASDNTWGLRVDGIYVVPEPSGLSILLGGFLMIMGRLRQDSRCRSKARPC